MSLRRRPIPKAPRGFASYLFLVFLTSLIVSQYAFQAQYHYPSSVTSTIEIQSLAFHRDEIEHGMDAAIAEKLQEGLLLNLPAEAIKTNINQSIIQFIQAYSGAFAAQSLIQIESGTAPLQTTNYFSLLQLPLQPLTLETLNAHSHLLVLPINQTQRYGEYTYTGGGFGSNIFFTKIASANAQTLAALPAGYRICVISSTGEIPCTP